MAETLIAKNFENFITTFSPSFTGGMLNFLYKPVQTATGTLLDMNTFDMETIVPYVKELFLSTKQNYPVLEVLPKELQPAEIKNSTYLIQIILLGVAFLISLGLFIGMLVIPCCWCCRKKRKSGGDTSKVCYIVMGAVTGAFLVFLILCLPLVFVSINSLASGIDGNSTNPENRGLKDTFTTVVQQTSEFLTQLPIRGRRITTELLDYAQTSLQKSLENLVNNLMNRLLTDYKVRELVADAENVKNGVGILQNITNYVNDAQKTTVNEIDAFQTTMKNHVNSLKSSLEQLCKKPPAAGSNDCQKLESDLAALQFNFDPKQLDLDQSQVLLTLSSFGNKISDVLQKFSEMETQIDQEIQKVISEIQTKFNITKELHSLINLWDTVDKDVSAPVIGQLNSMQPTVDSTLTTASKYIKLGGYAVLAVFSVVLLILLINGIIIVVQAALGRNPSSKAITCQMVCGLIIPAIICFLVPLLVVIGGVFILVSGLISNEGCRYIGNPKGVPITDGATNLYLQYMWPNAFNQHLDPSLSNLVDIPIPHNVLDGLLFKCKPPKESTPSQATDMGFLPAVGVDRFINVTGVIEQPQLQKAIADAEKPLVDQIRNLDINKMLSFNVTEVQDLIKKVDDMLNKLNFDNTIAELKKGVVNTQQINTLLDELEAFTKPLIPHAQEAKDIQDTIELMRVDLQKTTVLDERINTLIDALEKLQKSASFAQDLNKFGTTLEAVYKTLTTESTRVQPVEQAFRENVPIALDELAGVLQRASTRFTSEVITCGNINKIATSVVGATCANDGLINRFGAFFFLLLLFLCPLQLTVILFQVFIKMHGSMAG